MAWDVLSRDVLSYIRIAKPLLQASPLPPTKNHKNIGFSSKTGPDPLNKIKKATKPAFNVGPSSTRQRNAIYIYIWRIAGGPMMARL